MTKRIATRRMGGAETIATQTLCAAPSKRRAGAVAGSGAATASP